jgi:hypothetical protein
MEEMREFDVNEQLLDETCPICKEKFKLGEKIVLVPIQAPKGDYFINAISLPIHTKCYFVEKE